MDAPCQDYYFRYGAVHFKKTFLHFTLYVTYVFFLLLTEGSLVNKRDLNLSGTFCHRSGTRPPSCVTPRQPTIYLLMRIDPFSNLHTKSVKFPKKSLKRLYRITFLQRVLMSTFTIICAVQKNLFTCHAVKQGKEINKLGPSIKN